LLQLLKGFVERVGLGVSAGPLGSVTKHQLEYLLQRLP
jgi:hypothetical protein